MAQILLSAFLPTVIDRLLSLELFRFACREGVHITIKKWKTTLEQIQAVLSDAEEKQITTPAVKIWLDELRDLAYDADDIVDKFATEALRRKLMEETQSSTSKIRSLIPTCCTSFKPSAVMFNFKMRSKIEQITSRLQDISKQKTELNLIEYVGGTSNSRRDRLVNQTSSAVESHVYGREEDKAAILELLMRDEASAGEVCVIPIIAMGGVGKTTLANFVYNDDKVKDHFDMKAWVCVSKEFDLIRVTKAMLESFALSASDSVSEEFDLIQVTKAIRESFTLSASDVSCLNSLQKILTEKLSKQKFLLVLDDVWHENYNDWTILRRPLEAGAPGSKILVTARNQGVSDAMGTINLAYHLKVLSDDVCLSIFSQHALGTRDFSAYPNLKQTGEEIVKRCKGLALAAKVLGGLLRTTRNLDEWEDVLHSQIWNLPEGRSNIIPALRLSYDHLSPPLKQCFAYCSMLPKGYEFEEEELVLLWMAEGLSQQQSEGKQMEDIGGEYFRDLLSRSFFQVSSITESRFVMHDLINDLSQWVAGDICFRNKDNLEGKQLCKISKKVRYSSYVGSHYDGVKKLEAFIEVECNLRTFLALMTPKGSYLTNNILFNLLPRLRCLRVLSLSGYCITEIPDSIGGLKHLRYLNLSGTKIKSLPELMSTLYNLQTLILKDCFYLKKLPTAMKNLINLRHLNITNADSIKEMPLGLGQLTSLQKLSNFIVGNSRGSEIRNLMNLKHLRGTLCISGLENVIDAGDARVANLEDKQALNALTLGWSSELNDSRDERIEKDVLDMLQPHKKLKELTIKCYGGITLPAWVGDPSFSHMMLLRLENCVKCTSLPPLGQLSLLKDLCIKGMKGVNTVDLEFNGKGCPKPFPSLEVLSFEDMQEWEHWFPCGLDGLVEVFSHLRELSIRRCPKLLKELPNHLPCLEKLVIDECPQLAVSISSLPEQCELEIKDNYQKVVKGSVNSLKSLVLCNISKLPHKTQELVQGLRSVEDLKIVGSDELTSLWQKEVGLLQHLTSLHRLRIVECPRFASLVVEEAGQQEDWQPWGLPCRLEYLELDGCNNLEKLQGLHSLTSLEELKVKGCPRLVSFPGTGLPSMLRKLTIEICEALESIPQATMHHSNYVCLEYLRIAGCDSIASIARGHLPSTLKKLEIEQCKNLQSIQYEDEGSTSSSCSSSLSSSLTIHRSNNSHASLLEHLYILGCDSLTSLSSKGELPAKLKYLYVENCPKLEIVAERFHNNASLETIHIRECENLKCLPEGLLNLPNLTSVDIRTCPSLVSFSHGGGLPTAHLRCLWIQDCEKLETLPGMHNLTSLQEVRIFHCPGMVSFPEEGFPTNLTSVRIINVNICKPLFELGLYRLTSLRDFWICGGYPSVVSFPEGEEGMMLPTSLTQLTIQDFPNLEYLSSNGFQNLTSLEYLTIGNCPKLKSFPKEGLPSSLLQLHINECPLLKKRCKKDQGQYWPKIAHIPCVHIDGRFLFDPEVEKG